jgi:hypothetical protein
LWNPDGVAEMVVSLALHPVGPWIESSHVKISLLTFLRFLTMLVCMSMAWGIINNTLIINEISTANV